MLTPPFFTRWVRGPAAEHDGAVVVSVTDYAPHRRRDIPVVTTTGLRLSLGWYAMPGAVGLALWSVPHRGHSGSVSVWQTEEDLRRFVGLPRHREIMGRYRDRGRLRSTSWWAERFERRDVFAQARDWIA